MQKMITQRPMSLTKHVFHMTMCVATAGLWIPVYMHSRRMRRETTVFR